MAVTAELEFIALDFLQRQIAKTRLTLIVTGPAFNGVCLPRLEMGLYQIRRGKQQS